ncbi:MAG: hypothetical protein ACK6EB_30215, partial [Planctomyces sp.]
MRRTFRAAFLQVGQPRMWSASSAGQIRQKAGGSHSLPRHWISSDSLSCRNRPASAAVPSLASSSRHWSSWLSRAQFPGATMPESLS